MSDLLAIGLPCATLAAALLLGFRLLRGAALARPWRSWFLLGSLAAIAFVGVAAATLRRPSVPESEIRDRPIEVPSPGYATSDRCFACHPGEYASWRASYHRSMTEVASPATVRGDFENRRLELGGATFVLTREDDEFWVEMPEIDGVQPGGSPTRVKRRIVLTTGSHHMQAFWYNAGNTRVLGLLPFVYNFELERWTPRRASFILPPSDGLTVGVGRWNKVCIECHVTQGRLRPVEQAGFGGQDTYVTEFGIACESCHGPAAEHVASHRDMATRYRAHLDGEPGTRDARIVHPAHLPHDRSAEVCGQCHSTSVWTSQAAIDEFMQHGFRYRPGDRLADSKAVVRGKPEWNTPEVRAVLAFQPELVPNTFWADGMNRVSGREYNGLIETACFQRGEMSCLSCHQLHQRASDARSTAEWADDQLKPGMRGNLACTQCHGELAEPPRLTAHSHHEAGSTGSVCYNCHMPHTTYGLLKAIRSHQIDSPAVATSVETGRPNACNQCHLERTLEWSAAWLERWYDIPRPALPDVERSLASIPLLALQGDAGQRALAAWSMGWGPARELSGDDWQGLYLAILLADPYPAVRQIAYRSLRTLPGFEDFEYDPLEPLERQHEHGNAALERFMRQRVGVASAGRPSVLIDTTGPRLDLAVQLLRRRDDRPVSFAE